MPLSGTRADLFAQPLTEAMQTYAIDAPKRAAAFLAQLAHESGELRYVRELADGKGYEGRKDLGNTQVGDGPRYRGRGLIQITGRANYAQCGAALKLPLENNPELLELPRWAALSAAWFWASRKLSTLADEDKFGAICKAVNGGYNGLDDRLKYWLLARRALGL